jgi:hypothetical protein
MIFRHSSISSKIGFSSSGSADSGLDMGAFALWDATSRAAPLVYLPEVFPQ